MTLNERRNLNGTCHICGRYKELTFEHSPPKSAYNSEAVRVLGYVVEWRAFTTGASAGTVQPHGAGDHTLCNDCNERVTGSRYGTDYVNWIVQVKKGLDRSNAKIGEILSMDFPKLRPLRLLKQIVAFMLCANPPVWGEAHKELRKYVLKRDERNLPDKYRLFMFLTKGPFGRSIGTAGVLNVKTGKHLVVTEVSFPPCGFILAEDSAPEAYLQPINHFNHYNFDQKATVYLKLPIYGVSTPFPCDFRSLEQVKDDASRELSPDGSRNSV
jgi:hypothetical protein